MKAILGILGVVSIFFGNLILNTTAILFVILIVLKLLNTITFSWLCIIVSPLLYLVGGLVIMLFGLLSLKMSAEDF